MGQKSINRITIIVSSLSLIMAVIATYFSYDSYQGRREHFRISFNRSDDNYLTNFYQTTDPNVPGIVWTLWEGNLTNTSDRTLSIIGFDLWDFTEKKRTPIPSLGKGGGLLTRDGERLSFPIMIESGKSVSYQILIGLPLDPRAYAVLSEKYEFGKEYSIHDLKIALGKQNMDFFGNLVEFEKVENGRWRSIVKDDPCKDRLFIITFNTSRDNTFEELGFWYKKPRW